MTGVDETVGKQATSDSFKWAGTHAQGIRVTIVNGESGIRITNPIDYTNYKGAVDKSYDKATKLEYMKSQVLLESPAYTSMTPPTGMPTVLFNTADGSNNIETVRAYFRRDDVIGYLLKDNNMPISIEQFIENGYKVIVEPLAFLTVDGKVHAVTATESAILSKQFEQKYVVTAKGSYHPAGKPCNHIPIPDSIAEDIKKGLQQTINAIFLRDGYYCMSSACEATPPQGRYHQLSKNPYTWHLSSIVNRALPKALFLEKTDFDIPVGKTSSGTNLSAGEIISTYGIGIISYKDTEEPEEPEEPDIPPSGGDEQPEYRFDFISTGVKISEGSLPVREENDFKVSAGFEYQQEIDCKYCVTQCNLCGLTGRYQVQVSSGGWSHSNDCYASSGPCIGDSGCGYSSPRYEWRLCNKCYINCAKCEEGKLWYKSSMAGEYPPPVASVGVEVFVKNAKLDYTKGISGELRHSRSISIVADSSVGIQALLNAGEDIGYKDVVARINWGKRGSEINPDNNKSETNADVIPATNLQVEYISPNAPFRTGTEVISSFLVKNQDDIGALNIRPKHRLQANFTATNPDNGQVVDISQMSSIVIPKGGTNLIYFKWLLPEDYSADTVDVRCEINTTRSVNETRYNDNIAVGTNHVQRFKEQITPDTVFENKPTGFTKPSGYEPTPTRDYANNIMTSISYERWEWSNDYIKRKYSMELGADYSIEPDKKSPSRELVHAGLWKMRSGYGVDLTIRAKITSNLPRAAYTSVQNGNAYLPEFRYKNNDKRYRTLEDTEPNVLKFPQNENTITNKGIKDYQRVHFTPLWYPDGDYVVKTYIYDLWTPVGMMSITGDVNQLRIEGDMYDDWYLGHKKE